MKKRMTTRALTGLALCVLAACDQGGTGPLADDLTEDEVRELTVLEEDGSFNVAMELATVSGEVAGQLVLAAVPGAAASDVMEARDLFMSARMALVDGDRRTALEQARAARRLLARAIVTIGGPVALDGLVEHIEDLGLTAGEDEELFDDPRAMASELVDLSHAARALLAAGDPLGAGERALLGEQRVRFRRGRTDHRGDVRPERARLAVALAETAVALAEELIASGDVPVDDVASDVADRQNRWLVRARRMLERARTALANGHFARAAHFAHHAHWSALQAVILPGGVTEGEITAMVDLAERLLAEAEAAVGGDVTELRQRLLEGAGRLVELGKARLEEGHRRGVAALWRAAVICRWLLD